MAPKAPVRGRSAPPPSKPIAARGRREPSADDRPAEAPKDWDHPDGFPVSKVREGQVYDGVVVNAGQYGVFIDFGCKKNALLKVPAKYGRRYRRGMDVQGAKVLSVDAEADPPRIMMEPDQSTLPEPQPRSRSGSRAPREASNGRMPNQRSDSREPSQQLRTPRRGRSAGAGPKARPRPTSEPPRPRRRPQSGERQGPVSWDHPDGTPLSEIEEGAAVKGVVVNVSQYGVFVDVGAVRNARITAKDRLNLRRGDVLEDCAVDWVNLEANRLGVSIQDPQKAAERNRKPLEELEEGMVVNGVVDNRGAAGVFVNIGAENSGRLNTNRKSAMSFVRGQVIKDLIVEKLDLERRWITLGHKHFDNEASRMELVSGTTVIGRQGASATAGAGHASASTRRVAARPPSAGRPTSAFAKRGAVPAAAVVPASAAAKSGGSSGKPSPKQAIAPGPAVRPPPASAKARTPAPAPRERRAAPSPAQSPPEAAQREGARGGDVLDGLRVGDIVDGVVVGVRLRGVILDVAREKTGVLIVSTELRAQFQKGDRVQGMRVEGVDQRTGGPTLSIEEPELEIEEEASARPPATPSRKKGAVAPAVASIVAPVTAPAKGRPRSKPRPVD